MRIPLLRRSWYFSSVRKFLESSDEDVLARLLIGSTFSVLESQRDAWRAQLPILRRALHGIEGRIYLEFEIPRMGKRVDTILLVDGALFALEFKVGAKEVLRADWDQAYDYALDLKYFHEGSHNLPVIPILIATDAKSRPCTLIRHERIPDLYATVCSNRDDLGEILRTALSHVRRNVVDPEAWESSRYCPTPTIIDAARALYAGHDVADISRSDAGAINLRETSEQLVEIIEEAKAHQRKAICFVTGVPGAGKTLVGLNMATAYSDPASELHSVFLSGNGPLVAILREALARDLVQRKRLSGEKIKKDSALGQVKSFIQNVHHFRDEYVKDLKAPVDHVVIFDEAQRAWDLEQTVAFMRRKRGLLYFHQAEPEFLISCMDRRRDWAVIICLVGAGQEINTGEAGIREWIEALQRSFPSWHLYLSPVLKESEYGAEKALSTIERGGKVHFCDALHLAVSVRSFRSEKVAAFVRAVLDLEQGEASKLAREFRDRYPVVLTRDLDQARQWLRDQATGSERYGIVVSSQAERLKPYAVDVRSPMNPVKWFLDGKDDVRSSYYLEDVATEFHVQGLELDWACVCWDGDFRYSKGGWQSYSFRGTKWQNINKPERQVYLKNAYRVLLTRARQGMVIFIPAGSEDDPTRSPAYYNATFAYLASMGLPVL